MKKTPEVETPRPALSKDEWVEMMNETVRFIRAGNLIIRTKTDGLVKLIPNDEQNEILDYILECVNKGVAIRIIVLKARQLGMSTIIAAVIYVATSLMSGRLGLVAAHNGDGCNSVWRIYKTFKDHDFRTNGDGGLRFKYSSKKEVFFEGNDSGVYVAIADEDLGAGDAIQFFHATEYGRWNNPEDILESIMAALPDDPRTMAVLESTGEKNTDFEEQFRENYRIVVQEGRRKEAKWFPFFFRWFDHAKYRTPCSPQETRDIISTDDLEEKALLKLGVKPDQLNWRRRMIAVNFHGRIEKFRRQFPSTIDDAFYVTKDTWFDKEALLFYEIGKKDPAEGNILHSVELASDCVTPIVSEDGRGAMRMWEQPVPGHEYFIGADAASEYVNARIGFNQREKSESALCVVDGTKGNVVCCWNGAINASAFGDLLVALGYHYNRAVIAPEANAHGLSTIDRIRHALNYSRIYMYERVERYMGEESEVMGWPQTEKSRSLMLDIFQRLIMEYRVGIPDPVLIKQMTTFVRRPAKSPKAALGQRDDLVIAAGIAFAIASRGRSWSIRDVDAVRQAKARLVEKERRFRRKNLPRPEDFGRLFASP